MITLQGSRDFTVMHILRVPVVPIFRFYIFIEVHIWRKN